MGLRDTAIGLMGRALDSISRASASAATAVGGSRVSTDSGRAKKLQAFNDLYRGEQYDGKGLAASWDKQPPGGRYIPLKLQRPSTQYDLPRLIVDRPTAMLFGEGRFPELSFEPTVPADEAAKAVNAWLAAIADEGNLHHVALAWARQGAAVGTAVMTWSVVEGEFEFEPHLAYQCKPTFHKKKRGRLVGLEKRYKFKQEVEETARDGTRIIKTLDFWHREEWTETEHIVYQDALATADNREPMWIVEDQATHASPGRVPAVWVKNIDPGDASNIDGVSLLDGLADITEDIDRTLSQKSRAVRYNQDPERVYYGMNEEQVKKLNAGAGATTILPPKPAGGVELLEMNGEGQKIAEDHAVAQRGRGLETARVVAPNPETLLGAAKSAVALRILFSPMLELVGELRTSYGRALREILTQILDAARSGTLSQAGTLLTPPPATIPEGKAKLQWGRFFDPTPDDLVQLANAIVALKNAHILDDETILRVLAPYFDIKDIQHVLQKAKAEADEAAANENADMMGMPRRFKPRGGAKSAQAQQQKAPVEAGGAKSPSRPTDDGE